MQLPTHVLAGIFIQYLVNSFIPTPAWLAIILILIFCIISHFFIDAIAKITYHPPTRETGKFWLYWHSFVYGFGIFLILLYFQIYWIGILAANAVDIWDWCFLRNYATRTSRPDWGKKYYIHPIANKIRTMLFSRLPNFNHTKSGILPELLLYIGWLILYIATL